MLTIISCFDITQSPIKYPQPIQQQIIIWVYNFLYKYQIDCDYPIKEKQSNQLFFLKFLTTSVCLPIQECPFVHPNRISLYWNYSKTNRFLQYMIYKAAPAWSIPSKPQQHKQPPTPSPLTYSPATSTILTKSPSWKIGKQLRSKQQNQRTPSPASYQPSQPQKSNKMGIIGKQSRTKQNVNPVPGPGSYTINPKKDARYISFAKKYEIIDKTTGFPSPFDYNVPIKRDKRGASIGKQERFSAQNTQLLQRPGPGNYQLNNKTHSSIKFTKAVRMSHQPPKNNNLAGPGQYEIKGEFQKNVQKAKGYTLGQKIRFTSSLQMPGPADYSPTYKDLKTSPSISFAQKYREKQADRSPSPNQYDPLFQKTIQKSESFSIGKAQRMPLNVDNSSPGPGAYLKATYKTSSVEVSLGKSRKIEQKEDFPGPGAYNPNKEAIMKRPGTAKLGRSERFYKIKTQTSNASFYGTKVEFGSPKYSFSKKKRLDEKYEQGPGPGAYNSATSLSNLATYALKH